jgi:alpha-tubulin suppressor-like RCC1 family protein
VIRVVVAGHSEGMGRRSSSWTAAILASLFALGASACETGALLGNDAAGGAGIAGGAGSAGAAGVAGNGAGAGAGGTGGSGLECTITAGKVHTCARKPDGTLWCWGWNLSGQIGDGTTGGFQSVPVQVTSVGSAVAQIALSGGGDPTDYGVGHSCARKADGTVWCWGQNKVGQLGEAASGDQHPLPVQVGSLGSKVAEVTVGAGHACARKADGTAWCWGSNMVGQLGTGTPSNTPSPSPVQVTSLGASVAAISAGAITTCARKTDGTLWCWGGEGDGATMVQVAASLGSTIAEVAVGLWHNCARKLDGTLWCWGANYSGQLGDGTTTSKMAPAQVTSLGSSVLHVGVGWQYTCALKSDGTVWCWGSNALGQLGDGTTENRLSPVQVASLGASVAEVSVSSDRACARKTDDTIWCWGFSLENNLYPGNTCVSSNDCEGDLTPVLVPFDCQ